nr:uncharacterized protein LOC115262786 [Aedes albopictus]
MHRSNHDLAIHFTYVSRESIFVLSKTQDNIKNIGLDSTTYLEDIVQGEGILRRLGGCIEYNPTLRRRAVWTDDSMVWQVAFLDVGRISAFVNLLAVAELLILLDELQVLLSETRIPNETLFEEVESFQSDRPAVTQLGGVFLQWELHNESSFVGAFMCVAEMLLTLYFFDGPESLQGFIHVLDGDRVGIRWTLLTRFFQLTETKYFLGG